MAQCRDLCEKTTKVRDKLDRQLSKLKEEKASVTSTKKCVKNDMKTFRWPTTGWTVKKHGSKWLLDNKSERISPLQLPEPEAKKDGPGEWQIYVVKKQGQFLWQGKEFKDIFDGMACHEYYSENCDVSPEQHPSEKDTEKISKLTQTERKLKDKISALKKESQDLGENLLIDLVNLMSRKGNLNKTVKTIDGYEAGFGCVHSALHYGL